MAQWSGGTEGILRKNKLKDKHEDLLVFGYACKVFREDEKAQYIDQGKHLIPWMGDESLKIDRYDCRGHLSDLKPYEASREGYDTIRWLGLNESERKLEQLCDDERYYSLHINEEDEQLYKEEEEKRKKTNEFQYSYDVPGDPENAQEGVPTAPEANDDDEEYVAPIELDVPVDIEIPKTMKQSTRIEKTALFVSEQGMQMEILIKTKQGDNPQFSFLNQNDPLFKFYRHVLSAIKTGRYKVRTSKTTDDSYEEESHHDKSSDDHYLHPSLVATFSQPEPQVPPTTIPSVPYKPSANCAYSQLVNRIQGNQPDGNTEGQPVPPVVQDIQQPSNFNQATLEQQQQYYQYYYAAQYYEYYKQLAQYQQTCEQGAENPVPIPEMPIDQNLQNYIQQMVYAHYMQQQQQQNNPYAQIVTNVNKDPTNPYAALLANLQQHIPAQLTGSPNHITANIAADTEIPSPVVQRPAEIKENPPPQPAANVEIKKPLLSLAQYGSGSDSESSSDNETDDNVWEGFKVPTGETRTVIDKMAVYVSKNGIKFEEIVKTKADPRFHFLNNEHEYNKYYRNKIAELKGEKKPVIVKEPKKEKEQKKESTPPPPQIKKEKKVIAPVCFSIKKPKEDPPKEIKSALPMEESDDEEDETVSATTTVTSTITVITTSAAPVSSVGHQVTSTTPSHTPELPVRISEKEDEKKQEKKIDISESSSEHTIGNKEPLSTILQQAMKKNGIIDNDDPILEMIDLTDDLEERRDLKRAQDKIKDKLAAAAREKLASVARDRALQLERKRRAAAFLKLKSAQSQTDQNRSSAKESHTPTHSNQSRSSSRRSSIENDCQSKEKDRHKHKAKAREECYNRERSATPVKDRSRLDKHRASFEIEPLLEKEVIRERSSSHKKKHKRKHSRSSENERCSPKKMDVVTVDDSESEDGEIRKKKKSKKKKSHKRKHSKSKHDSRSRKKSKKKKKRSDSSSSASS